MFSFFFFIFSQVGFCLVDFDIMLVFVDFLSTDMIWTQQRGP